VSGTRRPVLVVPPKFEAMDLEGAHVACGVDFHPVAEVAVSEARAVAESLGPGLDELGYELLGRSESELATLALAATLDVVLRVLALLIGALILVPGLVWMLGVRPWRASVAELEDRIAAEQDLLRQWTRAVAPAEIVRWQMAASDSWLTDPNEGPA